MSEKSSVSRAKYSILIGVVCIFSYLVSYYSRNLASVTGSAMQDMGFYTKSFFTSMTTVYYITYASGQLFNGIMGDMFNPKRMIAYGLTGTALSSIAFPFLPFNWMRLICYALLGFSLSMLRGPLVKIIAENTSKNHSRVIGTFLSVATLSGPFIAANLFRFCGAKGTYVVAGIITCVICLCAMIVISRFERIGVVSYQLGKSEGLKGILSVFKVENFFFYMAVGAVLEISITGVVAWVPQYFKERFAFSEDAANDIYTVIALAKGLMPFLTLFLFRLSKENDILLLRIFFLFTCLFYGAAAFVTSTWANVVFVALALMAASCASAVLWSIYIPGLGKTGRVSSINGILDCTGYVFTAIFNFGFGFVLQKLNWSGAAVMWASVGLIGLIVSFSRKMKKAE